MMPPLFPVTLALYAVAGTLYLADLVAPRAPAGVRTLARAGRVVVLLAFLSQGVDIGWLCAHGLHPVVNAREAIFFLSWLMCGAYLATTLRYQVPVLGALVVPVAMVLDVAGRLTPTHEPEHAGTLLASVHITLATAGVALFAVAAGGAVLYLVSERNLKARRGKLGRGLPLETLDRINRFCVVTGFLLFTIAMVTGAVWVMRLSGALFTPQYLLATVTWLLYGGLLVARVTAGWRGRKAALVTLAGFGTAMAVLLIYLLRGAAA
jgi:ABC-type uncharacterized transport system permease subunit